MQPCRQFDMGVDVDAGRTDAAVRRAAPGRSGRGHGRPLAAARAAAGLLAAFTALLALPLQAQDYTPLAGLRVSDGRVQYLGFSSQCINLSSSINGVVYTTHTSKWQRRAGASWVDIPGTERDGLCSYSPTSPGEYRLVAEITIGGVRGRYSSENTLTVEGTTATGAPTNLEATAGDGQVTLNWTAPANDGGAAITGYQYRQQAGGGAYGNWMNIAGGASTNSHVVFSLTNGSSYNFQVRAVNSEGGGAASAPATATPTAPVTPPETGTVGVESFEIPNLGGWSITSSGTEAETQVGYGRIAADAGSTTPSGIAIIGYRPGGTLVAEAGVPASEPVQEGRIFAEVNGSRSIPDWPSPIPTTRRQRSTSISPTPTANVSPKAASCLGAGTSRFRNSSTNEP